METLMEIYGAISSSSWRQIATLRGAHLHTAPPLSERQPGRLRRKNAASEIARRRSGKPSAASFDLAAPDDVALIRRSPATNIKFDHRYARAAAARWLAGPSSRQIMRDALLQRAIHWHHDCRPALARSILLFYINLYSPKIR